RRECRRQRRRTAGLIAPTVRGAAMRHPLLLLILAVCFGAAPAPLRAQGESAAAQPRRAYVDDEGVVRWRGTDEEVRLFGANYALPSSSDYRAAGYLTQDRKRLVDTDLAHFVRMGWDGLRV